MSDESSVQAGQEAEKTGPRAKLPHPIAAAIDRLVHRARDIKEAQQFMRLAYQIQKKRVEEVGEALEKNGPLLDDPDRHTRVLAQKSVHATLLLWERLRGSDIPAVIQSGLFLALFSAFDAFTGDLLRGLYIRKPVLFNALDKTLTFAEVLSAPSIDVLKLQVLDDDLETFRRKSYPEQFVSLTNRFGVKLTEFDKWPIFVECSQRRNLITHCDGVVTDQYFQVCREAGIGETELPKVGSQVTLEPDYFFAACELIIEVGVKLGQTLWRKTIPNELEQADEHLKGALYSALENRSWLRAKMIGGFALGLPRLSSDFDRKVITVNYAQALKRGGEADQAKKIINEVDWSASTNDFKLARAVLLEDFEAAADLMRSIGEKGQLLSETGYHTWPLFIEFRETEQFAQAYQEVFGHPYAEKLREDASEASKVAAAQASEELPNAPAESETGSVAGDIPVGATDLAAVSSDPIENPSPPVAADSKAPGG